MERCSQFSSRGIHDQVYVTYDLNLKLINGAHRKLQHAGKIIADDKCVDKHDLLTLFSAVPADIRLRLRSEHDGDAFTDARHAYEARSRQGYSDILIGFPETMVDNVEQWYRQ